MLVIERDTRMQSGNKCLRLVLLVVLFCACLHASVAKPTADPRSDPNKPVLALEAIFHHSYYKRCKALISPSAIRIENGVFVWIMKAPDYKNLHLLNPTNKTYITRAADGWFSEMCDVKRSFNKVVKVGEGKIKGLSCTHYKCQRSPGNILTHFWVTKDVAMDKDLINSMCAACGFPAGYGCPVEHTEETKTKEETLVQNCLKTETLRKISVKPDQFNIPSRYKKVTDTAALYFSDDGNFRKKDLEDLFEHHF